MKVNEELPYWEAGVYSAPGATVGNATTGYYNVGSFTMPWPGRAILEAQVMVEWGGNQHVYADLYASTAAPNAATQFARLGCHIYANKICFIPVYAQWDLATVQTVTLTAKIVVGGGGNNVLFHLIYGYVRGTPQ